MRSLGDEGHRRLEAVLRAHLETEGEADPGRIGCYRLEDRIGRGSSGEVFRALDPEGHAVALKILDRRWRGERYARELELLERTQAFPGVVPLLDAGLSARGPYLVLELVPGGSLRAAMRERGKLRWEEALPLIGLVAETLRAIHAEGIVHRDLKPENLLLTRRDGEGIGRPLISDFGLAKDLSGEDGELTQAGLALGTLGYMAPELLSGKRDRLGPWTDVFSLGAVLYELVSGELPFGGRTLSEAARAMREDGLRPVSGLPSPVEAILRRSLSKETEARFANGGQLASAIEAALS